jgi:CubicO group peptidase (beta-lactamase class C family)
MVRLRISRLVAATMVAVAGGTVFSAATAARAQRPANPAWRAQVDRLFIPWDRRDSPGCALGVFKDGAIAYARGYGMADLEHDVPIVSESVFYAGSVSKQFTAMAAALAMEQGKLTPDDSIRAYLGELPEYAEAIKVRHLIHHTSGLRDYNTLLSIAGRRGDEAYDNPAVLRITARQKQLNFTPGAEYLYSNTGYTLLATIVERATKTPFAEYADANIFKPLGMTATHYHVDASRLVRNRALAYARGPAGEMRLDTPSNERAGAGGLFTNLGDLLRWDANFYDGRVGGKRVIDRLHTVEPLNDGKPSTYAWGLELGAYRGLRLVEHSGALGGYRAHLLRFPERHTSVALLCNLGSIAPGGLARQVADLVVPFTEPKPPAERSPGAGRAGQPAAAGAAEALTPGDYTGQYASDEIDSTLTVTADGQRLMLKRDADVDRAAMQPVSPGTFRVHDMTIRFERGPDGAVASLVVDAGRVRGIRFARLQ